ncbi:MAG: ThiF family adenylyltransferase [Gelidibacter sp.]
MIDFASIRNTLEGITFVSKIYDLKVEDVSVNGKIQIDFKELAEPLDFEIIIAAHYPLRSYDSESIKFKNKSLIQYQHVMGDGSICIHTSHNINLEQKLIMDLTSLKNWILRYYIDNENDTHYEHIIVPENTLNDSYYSFSFTNVEHTFNNGDYGTVGICSLSNGIYREEPIYNNIVRHFSINENFNVNCGWSSRYLNMPLINTGIYLFVKNHPANLNRFIFQDWKDLNDFLPDEFLAFLHRFERDNLKKFKGQITPVFIGYDTTDKEIHWQVALLEIGNYPLKGVPIIFNGKKTGKWKSQLTTGRINWAISRDSSYPYFFGRGALTSNITEKKILIIGIGAIGSVIAKTFVRGGCTKIDLADFDVKEPENVCRSEYLFNLGLNDKVDELSRILTAISPFVETSTVNKDYFQTIVKLFYKEKSYRKTFISELSKYDIVVDCTTDDDLMYILDELSVNCTIISMSITNKAKELIAGFHPNSYRFFKNQYNDILENDLEDLYNPTGCWSPTFKASYNEIDFLVQYAIKHINSVFAENRQKNNFVVKPKKKGSINYYIEEY